MVQPCPPSFFGVLFLTSATIRSLTAKHKVVADAHKLEKPQVPPAGPVIMIILQRSGNRALYPNNEHCSPCNTSYNSDRAFVGYIDDIRVMPGWFKPV